MSDDDDAQDPEDIFPQVKVNVDTKYQTEFANPLSDMQVYSLLISMNERLLRLEERDAMTKNNEEAAGGDFIDELKQVKNEYRAARIRQDRRNQDTINYLKSKGLKVPELKH